MRQNRCSALMVLCTCTLYGGQPEQKEQKTVEKRPLRVIGRTEQVLRSAVDMTGRLAMRTVGFAINYPRITFVIATVAPMAFPRYRYFVRRQTGIIAHLVTRRIGRWVQQSLRQWLLGPLDDRLDTAQQGLDEQHQILDGHTGQLTDLQETMAHVYGDTQDLLMWNVSLREQLLKVNHALVEHTDQLKGITEQGSAVHDQVKATHAKVEEIEEAEKAQYAQLVQIAEQGDATAEQVQKVSVSIDQLYAQLVKLDGRMVEGKTETVDKIELLSRHLGQLSAEQKQMFQDYGGQFSLRFDQLSENLRAILESVVAHPTVACGQQYRVSVKH